MTEGVGLMMEKTWAEYLTLTLTICGLPVELFEIFRKPSTAKFGVLAFNLARADLSAVVHQAVAAGGG